MGNSWCLVLRRTDDDARSASRWYHNDAGGRLSRDFYSVHSNARGRAANASADEMWLRGKIWTFAREEYRKQKLDGLARIDARLTRFSSLHGDESRVRCDGAVVAGGLLALVRGYRTTFDVEEVIRQAAAALAGRDGVRGNDGDEGDGGEMSQSRSPGGVCGVHRDHIGVAERGG